MRWDRSSNDDNSLRDVNMTPLIDVSLTLVLILLLATPLAFESAFGLVRAQASARRADDNRDVARVELELVNSTQVRVNRDLVAMSDLGATLRPLFEVGISPQVTVACADSVLHGTFVAVLDVTKASGARNIAVIGR